MSLNTELVNAGTVGAFEGVLGDDRGSSNPFPPAAFGSDVRDEVQSAIVRYGDAFAAELDQVQEEGLWGQLRPSAADPAIPAELVMDVVPKSAVPIATEAVLVRDLMPATADETAAEAVDPGRAVDTERSLFWLRAGFAAFLLLFAGGLGLLSFALETGAPALVRRLALVAMWAGPAAVATTAHLHGLSAGVYLFGKRLSEIAAIFAVGMFIIAIVGTIEFSVR